MPPKPATKTTSGGSGTGSTPIVPVTFLIKALPTFEAIVRGKIYEKEVKRLGTHE